MDLKHIVSKFKDSRILVVGDLMLDRFIVGTVSRTCPEAPVPVVLVDREYSTPGGAANVANNIRALGGKALITGVIGNDTNGKLLTDELKKSRIRYEGVFSDNKRPTTLKTRVMAQHQHIARIDKEAIFDINKTIAIKILSYVNSVISDIDAIIIEDYGKGVITRYLLGEIIKMTKDSRRIINVDPREGHFSYYTGVTAITANRREASIASGIKIMDKKGIEKAGKLLLKKSKCKGILITLGKEGMCLFEKAGGVIHIPPVPQEVFDVSGAGDTVVSAFTLALSCKANMKEAAYISNYAASVVVGKMGISLASKRELVRKIASCRPGG